jgi:transitional endoplasmic reticulum ATPase
MARMPVARDVDMAALAAATEGASGAELAGLCRQAGLQAMARAGAAEPEHVTVADFTAALAAQKEIAGCNMA